MQLSMFALPFEVEVAQDRGLAPSGAFVCVAKTKNEEHAAPKRRCSEEVCLLHNAEELLLIHLTVSITICLVNHFLQFLIGHPLAQLLGHALQVLERDLARPC